MIMTYEFALMAQKDAKLMNKIIDAMASLKDELVYTDIHKISFFASKQTVVVEPLSANSPFHHKVTAKEIKYSAVRKMLDDNWDICEDEIMDA